MKPVISFIPNENGKPKTHQDLGTQACVFIEEVSVTILRWPLLRTA